MKKFRQAGAGVPVWEPAAMKAISSARKGLALSREAMAIARRYEDMRPAPGRSRHPAGCGEPSRLAAFASRASKFFWHWLLPAVGVIFGAAVLFAALLLYCFLRA